MKRSIDTINLPRSKILELKNLGYNTCEDIINNEQLYNELNLESLLKAPESKTAFELFQNELMDGCILSYNKQLDELLVDVIAPRTITELTGTSGSGKTQICFQLCTTVQLPRWCGGLEGEAIFISTNRNFASHRLREFARDFVLQYEAVKVKLKNNSDINLTEDFLMKRIHYLKIDNTAQLLSCLQQLGDFLVDKKIKILIIDSISYPLRLLEVKNRIAIISKVFEYLRDLANKFNFAVVLTNDLTTRISEDTSYTTPSFGDSFYHLVNSRILLSKQGQTFNGKLIKNTQHAQKEVNFYL